MKRLILTTISLWLISTAHADLAHRFVDQLSQEEMKYYRANLIMETYQTDKPSSHQLDTIKAVGTNNKPDKVLAFNFGREDAESAQAYGRKLFWEALNGGQSEAEIWKAAWQSYGNDRFFARCFAQEAKSGYDQAYQEVLKTAVKIKTEADIGQLPLGTFFIYPNGQLSRRTQ